MAELKMFAAGIDNGSHFNMRAKNVTLAWKNMWEVENEAGKSVGSPWNHRAPSARYNGHEVPVASFGGLVDTNETALGSDAGGSMFVNLQRLGSLQLHGSAYILYPALSDIIGPPFLNHLTGSIPCTINSISYNMDNTHQRAGSEYIVNYNMQLYLVSGPV